jgi:hypothetical protein
LSNNQLAKPPLNSWAPGIHSRGDLLAATRTDGAPVVVPACCRGMAHLPPARPEPNQPPRAQRSCLDHATLLQAITVDSIVSSSIAGMETLWMNF